MSAHDLYISIFQVECLVASENPFVAGLSGRVLVKFGRGQVGYGGNAQRGRGYCWSFSECVGIILKQWERFELLQGG